MTYLAQKEKELQAQIIPQNMKDDFSAFWQKHLDILRATPLQITRKVISTPYDKVFTTELISFSTHDDTIVEAFFSYPFEAKEKKLPCVALFHGGGGYKTIHPEILATGVCCFAIDVRSQGGTTIDKALYQMENLYAGLMTRDLLYKDSFYMRNIYLDAVRTIDVIAQLPEVDASRIVSYGISQGGALSIVAGALSGNIKKVYAVVPSYSCLKHRTNNGSGVFSAVKKHLTNFPAQTDAAMDTLSYFDINNIVSMLQVPISFLLGLEDPVCLPPFVYSPYHHTTAPKEITLAPFSGHFVTKEYTLFFQNELLSL